MLKNTDIIRAVIATPNNADRITVSIMLLFELVPSEQLQINTVNKIVIKYIHANFCYLGKLAKYRLLYLLHEGNFCLF